MKQKSLLTNNKKTKSPVKTIQKVKAKNLTTQNKRPKKQLEEKQTEENTNKKQQEEQQEEQQHVEENSQKIQTETSKSIEKVKKSKRTEKVKNTTPSSASKEEQQKVVDEPAKGDTESDEMSKRPPIHFFLHVLRKFLKISITLHKIPEQYINLDMKKDGFHIDTLKYTKKYDADVEYHGNVKVNPNEAKATFEHGILNVVVPVIDIPPETLEKELKVLENRREARNIKFPPPVKKVIQEREDEDQKRKERNKRRAERKAFLDGHGDLERKRKKRKNNK